MEGRIPYSVLKIDEIEERRIKAYEHANNMLIEIIRIIRDVNGVRMVASEKKEIESALFPLSDRVINLSEILMRTEVEIKELERVLKNINITTREE